MERIYFIIRYDSDHRKKEIVDTYLDYNTAAEKIEVCLNRDHRNGDAGRYFYTVGMTDIKL